MTETNIDILVQTQRIVVDESKQSTHVTTAGPAGPPGPPGSVEIADMPEVYEMMEAAVAEHNQSLEPHRNVTSGRDFAARFETGLI